MIRDILTSDVVAFIRDMQLHSVGPIKTAQ